MFYTIPKKQSNEITVEVVGASGEVVEYGPILPGLRKHETHSSGIRYYYLFNQLMDTNGPYLDAYLEKLRREVAESAPAGGGEKELLVRIETDYIRLLDRINEDGRMTLRKSVTLGPFPVESR
jgi:hypothetical protein